MKSKTEKKKMNIFLKIFIWVFGVILGILVLVIGGLNVLKFAIYSEYYGMMDTIITNPGLNDGYIPQGLAVSEENEIIITSGYMNNKTASRLYLASLKDKSSTYVTLSKNGEVFTGHVGGVATTGDYVYIANNKTIYTVAINDIIEASKTKGSVEIGDGSKVNNSASFVYTDETDLYVGEFHDGGAYITDHPYTHPSGDTNYAIITKYSLSDLSKPLEIYSIMNRVQGFCITPEGKMVFSTSYGLTSSKYYVFNKDEITASNETLDDATVYHLGECINTISGPAMSEDLDYYDGYVLTHTESASNKYIFGKLFFATNIDGLKIA